MLPDVIVECCRNEILFSADRAYKACPVMVFGFVAAQSAQIRESFAAMQDIADILFVPVISSLV